LTKGYTVFASDEARREYEKQPRQARRKKECPACEIKAETFSANDKVEAAEPTKEGDK